MTSISFRSPVAKPLYRLGGASVPGGPRVRTLNDPATFEITQNAAGHMATTLPGASRNPAIDIGNGYEGEPILALAQGWASRISDSAAALGVRTNLGAGVTFEVWHLNAWLIPPAGAFVKQGQALGYLGHTGLGSGAHCHIEIKVNGKAIDPEPYIFGTPLELQDDMFTATGWSPIVNRKSRLTVGSNFRSGTSLDSEVIKVFAVGTELLPVANVSGAAVGTNDRWYVCALWVDTTASGTVLNRTVMGFFHSSVVAPLVPVEAADCAAEVAAATADAVKRVDLIKGDAAQIVPILERMRSR